MKFDKLTWVTIQWRQAMKLRVKLSNVERDGWPRRKWESKGETNPEQATVVDVDIWWSKL